MGRFTTFIGALVVVVAACSGSASPAVTPGQAVATPASATPAPTTTPVAISATVTYDGQSCKYDGPAVVPLGAAVTFTLVNAPAWAKGSLGAGLLVTPVRDGTTWGQVLAYAETRHVFPLPEWMRIPGTGLSPDGAEEGLGEALSVIPEGELTDETGTTVMTRNLYVVVCNTHPDEQGHRPYPAILLTTRSEIPTPAPTATPVAISATVTFDGQTCKYAGPAVIPLGAAVTFTLVNTPAWAKGSLGAALLVAPVRDGTTWADALAWAETQHVFPLPEWMKIPGTDLDPYEAGEDGLGEALSMIPDGRPVDLTGTIVMTRNQYFVECNTSPDEGQVPYPAILLQVMKG